MTKNCDRCGSAPNKTPINRKKIHRINLGRMEYGSELDGCIVGFYLCDTCVSRWVDSLSQSAKDKIYNSFKI